MRVAVLDDLEQVAQEYADWSPVREFAAVDFFTEHIASRARLVAALQPFDVVVLMRERTAFPREVIQQLPKLRLIVTTGAVNASVDFEACAERGVVVCGTGSLGGGPAELTWALILAAARRLDQALPAMRDGGWPASVGVGLTGRRLGVLGLGRVGAQVARIGNAFEMDVVAWSPHLTDTAAEAVGARRVSRDELLRSSDLVTLHAPLTSSTRRMIGTSEMSAMKPTAWLVNTARAGLIDTDALVTALWAGTIGGAALDVFDEEPLPDDSPLRRLGNALLTPHLGYVTDRAFRHWYHDVVEDIVRWREGRPIRVISNT